MDRKLIPSVAVVAALAMLAVPGDAGSSGATPKQVFVVNTGDASVSLVDLESMKEMKRYPVGPRPYGIAVSRDGKTVAVGVEDEEKVKFFSLPEFQLKGEVKIGKMFNDHIVLTKDGKHILVANFYSDDVVGIGMETMKEEFRIKDCSAPHVVRYGPLEKHVFVTYKKITGVAIIDPDNRKLVQFHQLTVNPRSLTFSPDESKVYFGSFWVNGFFEADLKTGKVTRLFSADPPKDNAQNQEVTYHGVQAVHGNVILAANEGRSYVDAFDMVSAAHLSRFSDVSKPCCIEPIPGTQVHVLCSNIGEGTLQRVAVSPDGTMRSLGKAQVGKAPKRVAFLPAKPVQQLMSGPQPGTNIPGPFHPINVTGPFVGKRNCLVETYGSRPVAMIFARAVTEPLLSLLKKIDTENMKDKKIGSFAVFLTDDDNAMAKLTKLAEEQEIKKCVLCLGNPSGPKAYRLDKDAEVTVILYTKYKVQANFAFRKGQLREMAIEQVMTELRKISPD